MISQWLTANLPRKTDEGLINLKDLLTVSRSGCRATRFVIVGRGPYGDGKLLILHWLMANSLRRTDEALLNLKDLLAVVAADGRATISGLIGRLRRGKVDLLIPQGLFAKWVRRSDAGLFNLKDLLTVFPPTLNGSFENEPARRRLLATKAHQILPFLTRNVQIRAENGGFSTPVFGMPVQSRGGCQAVNGGPRYINERMVVVQAGTSDGSAVDSPGPVND